MAARICPLLTGSPSSGGAAHSSQHTALQMLTETYTDFGDAQWPRIQPRGCASGTLSNILARARVVRRRYGNAALVFDEVGEVKPK